MSMPVKLSDALVLDARLAGAVLERSIAGQVEFWARLGKALEPVLNGAQAMAVCSSGAAASLAQRIAEVEAPAGRERLARHLAGLGYPHYEPHPGRPDLLVRVEADGTRTAGRFVRRVFTPAPDA